MPFSYDGTDTPIRESLTEPNEQSLIDYERT
jgi:hypothetical protein